MAPKAQKEPFIDWGANKYTNNLFTWGWLELQKNSNIG